MRLSRFLVDFGVARGLVWPGEWSNTLVLILVFRTDHLLDGRWRVKDSCLG